MDWGEVISISRVVEGMVGGGLNLFTKEKGNKREQRSAHRVRMGTQ